MAERTKIRGRWVRLGDWVVHHPSGDPLGEVVQISDSGLVITFDKGPRGRGIATRYEVAREPYRRGAR